MSDDNNIWERPLGLQGVWGSIIYDWLDTLLPDDADLLVKEEVRQLLFMRVCDVFDPHLISCASLSQLHILLTPVPSFGKSIISQFDSRKDLIQANMASVHLVSHGHTISSISQNCKSLVFNSSHSPHHLSSTTQPWFLDGNLTSNYRGKPHIDGSFLAQPSDYLPASYLQQQSDTQQQINKPLIVHQSLLK